MSYPGIQEYFLSAQASAIPAELEDSRSPMPMPSKQQMVVIPSSSGDQTVTSGGQHRFDLPAVDWMRAKEFIYRVKVSASIAAAGTWNFNCPTKCASRIIDSIVVTAGGQQLDNMEFYSNWHDAMMLHAGNQQFYSNDSSLLEGAGVLTRATADTFDFDIPLLAGAFNAAQDFPAWMLRAPISVVIKLRPAQEAIFASAGVNSYTVSQASIVYEQVSTSDSYKAGILADMAKGKVFEFPMTTVRAVSTSCQNSLNFNIASGLASVKAVLYTHPTADITRAINEYHTSGTISSAQLKIDGKLVNQQLIDAPVHFYSELQRSLGGLYDHNTTSVVLGDGLQAPINGDGANAAVAATLLAEYPSKTWLSGFNLTRFRDSGFVMNGTNCGRIDADFRYTTGAGKKVIFFVVYEQIVTIDINGVLSVKANA
jgi:hypothetical protein